MWQIIYEQTQIVFEDRNALLRCIKHLAETAYKLEAVDLYKFKSWANSVSLNCC